MKTFLKHSTYNPYGVNIDQLKFNNIQVDSRLVKKKDIFIALVGYRVDSHQYIKKVLDYGASLVIADSSQKNKIEQTLNDLQRIVYVDNTRNFIPKIMNEWLGYPSHQLDIYGVTGTNGKTTVATMISQVLKLAGSSSALIGTIAIEYEKFSHHSVNTTPDSHTLQNLLYEFNELDIQNLAMEVSSISITEKRVQDVDFSVAIFTNLSKDHMDYHQTMESYYQAKSLLFKNLRAYNARGQENFAVLNADDPYCSRLTQVTKARVKTYSMTPGSKADYLAIQPKYSPRETTFTLQYPGGETEIITNFLGEFNVLNTLAAIAALHAKGVSMKEIKNAFALAQPVAGRFQIVSSVNDDLTVIVDYAHTPDGLDKLIRSTQNIYGSNIWTIFGCMGDRDRSKRPQMSKIATQLSKRVVFTSNDPRTEDLNQIFNDLEKGAVQTNYQIIFDRRQAIHQTILNAPSDEVIIIAGKGHSMTEIIGTEPTPFDEKKIIKDALDQRRIKKTQP